MPQREMVFNECQIFLCPPFFCGNFLLKLFFTALTILNSLFQQDADLQRTTPEKMDFA